VKRRQLRRVFSGSLVLGAAILLFWTGAWGVPRPRSQTKASLGKLTGVVLDLTGIPQMGASVRLLPENTVNSNAVEMLTNTSGVFASSPLLPGLYTVRVTLAGFLPGFERHVQVSANLTTLVRVELESLFTSLDRLRQQPTPSTDGEDWKWVLRSAAAMRPVLQWTESGQSHRGPKERASANPHARLELTTGTRRSGSVSNISGDAGTAFAYDQELWGMDRLLIAGQVGYEGAPAAGLATVWLPTGSFEAGPHTSLVLRQAKLGSAGPTFRGLRIEQGGALGLGDRVSLQYGGEYVLVSLNSAATSVRPRAVLNVRLDGGWSAALIFTAETADPMSEGGEVRPEAGATLRAALDQLDAFPVLLWRGGHPLLADGRHEEISMERRIGGRRTTTLQFAAMHDDSHHSAVFGRGIANHPDFFQDAISGGFAYDGGSSNSWGARAAVREKLSDGLEVAAVYAYAGALTPSGSLDGDLRDGLETRYFNSLGASVSARVPRTRTRLVAGYKWIGGPAVSRLDGFGDSLYQLDPYFSLQVRQPLPKFGPGRWEALAECENLFAQGYLEMANRDGNFVLVPALRSIRGGVSLQF